MTSEESISAAARDSAYFDQWYADMAASSVRDAMIARAFGRPPEQGSASLLTAQGSAELADALRLQREGLVVQHKTDWRQAERHMWEHVVAEEGSDAAVRSLRDEGRRSLAAFDSLRRVMATATAPSA